MGKGISHWWQPAKPEKRYYDQKLMHKIFRVVGSSLVKQYVYMVDEAVGGDKDSSLVCSILSTLWIAFYHRVWYIWKFSWMLHRTLRQSLLSGGLLRWYVMLALGEWTFRSWSQETLSLHQIYCFSISRSFSISLMCSKFLSCITVMRYVELFQ